MCAQCHDFYAPRHRRRTRREKRADRLEKRADQLEKLRDMLQVVNIDHTAEFLRAKQVARAAGRA